MGQELFSVEEAFQQDGVLAKNLDEFEARPSQVAMAKAVQQAIIDREHLCVEAATGTGKTLAYLIPAILSNKRVVISTATKNLQDELLDKDLPLLSRYLDTDFKVTCMKGRNNYLCLQRLNQVRRQGQLLSEKREQLESIASWSTLSKTGDRSELEWLADDDPLWGTLDARSDTCTGQACDYFKECFVTRMRQRAFRADITIVNHALFFSNLALEVDEIGTVLPDFSVLILDEAHQVEDIVAQHFGHHLSNLKVNDLILSLQKVFTSSPNLLRALAQLQKSSLHFFESFPQGLGNFSLNFFPSQQGTIDLRDELASHFSKVMDNLRLLESEMQLVQQRPEEWEPLQAQIDRLISEFDLIFVQDRDDQIYWFERRKSGVFLHATPANVSRLLREKLFSKIESVILTSATLTTNNNFNYLKERLGVPSPIELDLPCEFDYQKQSVLFIPSGFPNPGSEHFQDAAIKVIQQILEISYGHAFILCTSFSNMNLFYEALSRQTDFPLLRQGQMPRNLLLNEFKKTSRSVLCATSSFWQGVDVKGSALRAVIIDKLPFQVPTEPVVAARLHKLREEGKDPFFSYTLPEAIITLKQGLGRLIRSRDDKGILAVLDTRLRTKGYGHNFLESLPKCTVTDTMQTLKSFCPKTTSRSRRS